MYIKEVVLVLLWMEMKVLTLEYWSKSKLLEMHLNEEGIDSLIEILQNIKMNKAQEHYHLMSDNFGGSELTSEKQCVDEQVELINHLKVLYWNA